MQVNARRCKHLDDRGAVGREARVNPVVSGEVWRSTTMRCHCPPRQVGSNSRMSRPGSRKGLCRNPIVGAGVSCSVGLPSWWEMIRSLTVTMMSERVNSTLAARDLPETPEQTGQSFHQRKQTGPRRRVKRPFLWIVSQPPRYCFATFRTGGSVFNRTVPNAFGL